MDGLGIITRIIIITDFDNVSILVSYWMGWELTIVFSTARSAGCFNPSFLLDGLGILSATTLIFTTVDVSILVSYWMGWEYYELISAPYGNHSFNPSFLLDGLGILLLFVGTNISF